MTEGIPNTHVVGHGLIMTLNIFCVEFKESRCLENSTAGRFLYYLWSVGRMRSISRQLNTLVYLRWLGRFVLSLCTILT